MTSTATALAARNRSYSVARNVPVGTVASFTEDIRRNIPSENFTVWTPVTIPAGAPVKVRGYTDAGFRGVEVAVEFEGQYVHGVSAGLLA